MLHIVRDYILRLSALAAFLNLLSKCFVNTVKSRCSVSFQQFSYSLSVKHQSSATQKLTVVDYKVIFCHFWHEQTDPYFHSLFGPQPPLRFHQKCLSHHYSERTRRHNISNCLGVEMMHNKQIHHVSNLYNKPYAIKLKPVNLP